MGDPGDLPALSRMWLLLRSWSDGASEQRGRGQACLNRIVLAAVRTARGRTETFTFFALCFQGLAFRWDFGFERKASGVTRRCLSRDHWGKRVWVTVRALCAGFV